jgi:hypothetical protein
MITPSISTYLLIHSTHIHQPAHLATSLFHNPNIPEFNPYNASAWLLNLPQSCHTHFQTSFPTPSSKFSSSNTKVRLLTNIVWILTVIIMNWEGPSLLDIIQVHLTFFCLNGWKSISLIIIINLLHILQQYKSVWKEMWHESEVVEGEEWVRQRVNAKFH